MLRSITSARFVLNVSHFTSVYSYDYINKLYKEIQLFRSRKFLSIKTFMSADNEHHKDTVSPFGATQEHWGIWKISEIYRPSDFRNGTSVRTFSPRCRTTAVYRRPTQTYLPIGIGSSSKLLATLNSWVRSLSASNLKFSLSATFERWGCSV